MTTTLTVQDVLDASQADMVNLIGQSNPAIISMINRVHLDLLRHSRWKFLLSDPVKFTATVGSSDYLIASGVAATGVIDTGLQLSDLDIIKPNDVAIYGPTLYYTLFKTDTAPLDAEYYLNGVPHYWLLTSSTGVLSLYPYPDQAYVIKFQYYKTRTTLTDPTDALQLPDQYFDVLVAGVNEQAALYISLDHEQYAPMASYWAGKYAEGKRGMIRDANLFPRADFIAPSLP